MIGGIGHRQAGCRVLPASGCPPKGIHGLHKHRLAIIVLMAIGAWAFFIGAGWMIWQVFS
jgi:hypothetical protein